MNRLTKASFLIGITLLVYSYLCRMFNIFFFWDSKIFGWIFLFLSLIGFLFGIHKKRKHLGRKTIWVKIGIGLLLLYGLIIMPFVIFKLKTSKAYQTAIEYLKTDSQIKTQIGNIKNFGLIPTGEMQTTTINGAESGNAIYLITLKGNKKYKDVTVHLEKTTQTEWTVTSVEN